MAEESHIVTAMNDEPALLALLSEYAAVAYKKDKTKDHLSVEERMALETTSGLLVPVIGPGASSRGGLPGNRMQQSERRRCEHARLRLQRLICASREGSGPQFTPLGPNVDTLFWAAAAEMLDNMSDTVYGPGPEASRSRDASNLKTGGCAALGHERDLPSLEDLVRGEDEDPGLRLLIHLQLHVSRTLAAATRIWAAGLRRQPRAFGPLFADEGVELTLGAVWNGAELEAFWHAVLDSLNAASRLAEHCRWPKPDSPEITALTRLSCSADARIEDVAGVLRPELVYVRMLQFVGETGADGEMWEYVRPDGREWYQEFTDEHLDVISALQGDSAQTLMEPTGKTKKPPPVAFCSAKGNALRRRHLEWLASLLRHTFVAPTQAYRNRTELAFAVSLDIPPKRTSPMPLRAWDLRETELSWPFAPQDKRRFTGAIRNALDRSCHTESGHREPSQFIQSLARLVHWSAQCASAPMVQGIESGLVLTTALDLEMEIALSRLGAHRVLMPVWVSISVPSNTDTVPGWLLATWRPASASQAYDPLRPASWSLIYSGARVGLPTGEKGSAVWRILNEDDFSHAEGPLLVKLEGSPLHDPTKWAEHAEGSVDIDAPSDRRTVQVESRLPLGEADLFEFLQGALPQEQVTLYEKLAKGTLVFIGHDAFQWGDRAHHFGIRYSRATRDGDQNSKRAFTAVTGRPRDGLAYDDGLGALEHRMGVEPLGDAEKDASSLSSVAKKIIRLACGEGPS